MFNYSSDIEQAEALQYWWQKNKFKLIVAIAILLGAIAALQEWQIRKTMHLEQASTMFNQLLSQKKPQLAHKLVQNFSSTAYADLAQLWLAQDHCQNNNWQQAIMIYDNLLASSKVLAIKNIATWYKTHALIELNQLNTASKTLAGVTSNYDIVNELKGDIFNLKHDKEQAYTAYSAAIDASKDPSIKQRVQIKRQVLFNEL